MYEHAGGGSTGNKNLEVAADPTGLHDGTRLYNEPHSLSTVKLIPTNYATTTLQNIKRPGADQGKHFRIAHPLVFPIELSFHHFFSTHL